ncbi:MAG: tetratricopeptide repeat protein, partial [Caldiserica bacterium]|nr:tetratricopeptide repeat protein [Caldisericota bacterium]
ERAYQEAKKREEERRQQEIARQKEEAIQQLLKEAGKALSRKEFATAEKIYRAVLQKSPGRKEAELGLRKVEEARARAIEETKLEQKSQVESEAVKEARLKAEIIKFEKKLREKKIKESAEKLLEQGVTYLKQKEYEKAIGTFEEILSRYPSYPEAKTYLTKAKDLLERSKKKKIKKEEAIKERKIDTYYTLGYRYFRKEQFKQAIQEFQKVLTINPEHKNAKFFLELSQEGEKAKSIREEKERQRALLTVHYKEARHLYNQGDYEDAISILEVVVAKDPQFKEAVYWLNQAKLAQAKLEGKKLEEELRVERERRLLEVEKASIPSRKPGEYKKAEIRKKTSAEETLAIAAIRKKAMQKVSLEFTNANLRDVIMFLSRRTGINIVIDESIFRGGGAAAAPAPEPAPTASEAGGMPPAPGEEAAAATPQPNIPSPSTMKITASLRDIPLIEALKVLLYSRGLGFVIKPYYIWVTYLYKSLKTEVFDLQFLALPRIPLGAIRTEGGEGGGVGIELQKGIEERLKEQGAAGGGAQGAEAGGTTEGNEMLILLNQLFPPVPGGSRQIIPSQNRLVVRDTEENIENIRKFLNSLSIPYQVSVEARFITVSADALKDIGLELSNFNLNVVGPYNTKSRQSGIPGQSWQYDTMTGSLMSGVGTPLIGMISGSQGLNIAYTRLNYPQFSAVLHLLMARSDTQVLSAPKVTVINGQLAQIRFVRNIPYVSDVDASTSTTGTGESAKSTTTFDYTFKSINVGIILNVIPRIFGENILLSLNPTVSDVAEFKTFIVAQTAGESPLTIEQPVPEVQDASTQLIVHDGDTVVLGGLMKGKTVEALSKIPFLGDIPVIGRAFFQKKTKGQEKRNLLIFITVKRMDTSGEPLNTR